jgi:hypothetical protein
MKGTAFILIRLIRSVVANPGDRQLFDHWYQTDHIPIIFFQDHQCQLDLATADR